MSRFFPRVDYAEDQPYASVILTSHVLHRGAQVGAGIGLVSGAVRALLHLRRTPQSAARPPLAPPVQARLSSALLRSTGVGVLYGTGLMALAFAGKMYGKSDIEWQDRSWRLLANEGQLECDDWSTGGSVLGGAATAVREGMAKEMGRGRAVRVVGGVGMGNLAGVAGYMLWRYAMHGGKRDSRVA